MVSDWDALKHYIVNATECVERYEMGRALRLLDQAAAISGKLQGQVAHTEHIVNRCAMSLHVLYSEVEDSRIADIESELRQALFDTTPAEQGGE